MSHETPVKILTIDDESAVRRSIRAYLEDSDYSVIEACDGQEGLDVFRIEKPDLVLCDLRMPEVDGLQVLAEVTTKSPETPIIIVSGTGVIGDAIEAVRLGAWDYVLKPIEDMGALEHTISKTLERASLIRQNRAYQEHLEEEVKNRTAELQAQAIELNAANEALKQEIVERKRAEEALRESETQYRSLIEDSHDAIYLLARGKFEIINRRFSGLFGVTPEEVKAPDFNFMQMIAPRSRPLIEERVRMAERGEEPPPRYEFTALRKDGKEIEVEASVSRIRHKGEIATQGILRDITERKIMETQLRQAQKMEAIGTLAGGIAHDFNNILMAMLGYADMAKQDLPDDSVISANLQEVLKAGERATDLVKQILAFSHQTEQERKPIQIYPIVKEVLKLLRASLPTTIEIQQTINTNCGAVFADPTQIHQVMMNLCTNAYHAMREKGGVLEVSLSGAEVDSNLARTYPNLHEGIYVRLTVRDTGQGMDKATQERIFEPFYTTKGVGEGTGMGLATVHGIVTSCGGAITVYSEPGKGSTFHVYLPRLQSKTPAEISETGVVPLGNESVLLVDDEEQVVRMEKQMLEHLGYRVTVRTSSVEALEAFRAMSDKFDLVITDQTMPNMTGVELAKELLHIRPGIPIILISGFSETVTPEKAKQIGIREYLMKPIITCDLGRAVRQVLEDREKSLSQSRSCVAEGALAK